MGSDADHSTLRAGDGHQAAGRVALEPPFELRLREPARAPGLLEQSNVGVLVPGLVRDELDVCHFVEVPRAALKMRRACVPATVSLSAIRSQAPERTSSNVRGG